MCGVTGSSVRTSSMFYVKVSQVVVYGVKKLVCTSVFVLTVYQSRIDLSMNEIGLSSLARKPAEYSISDRLRLFSYIGAARLFTEVAEDRQSEIG